MERLQDLIEKCKANDKGAQRELFELFASRMMMICMRYSKSREDAEDMLQEGFIKVFQKMDSFKGDSSLLTWMTRIFINTTLSEYRKGHLKFQHIEFEGDKHEKEEEPNDDFEEPKSAEEVLEAIQKLPEIYRIIINMYAIDNLNHLQIAEELGISEGTSKSRLSRARQMLKELLNN